MSNIIWVKGSRTGKKLTKCHFLAATAAQEAHLSVRACVRAYVTRLEVLRKPCCLKANNLSFETLQLFNIATLQL